MKYVDSRVFLHLDHSSSRSDIELALSHGLDSIMVDGSELPSIDDNIIFTRSLAEIVHREGAAVEAELGRLAGEEVIRAVSFHYYF